jgi:hypothetical protein
MHSFMYCFLPFWVWAVPFLLLIILVTSFSLLKIRLPLQIFLVLKQRRLPL